jgi:predicted AAA+ superfamily ATPase
MVDLLLVRRLQPWASNGGKRLVRSPKVYVRDSGLLHTLLGIQDQETLLGHPVIGSRWEGMIIENILATVPTNTRAWFYRTRNRPGSGDRAKSAVGDRDQAFHQRSNAK